MISVLISLHRSNLYNMHGYQNVVAISQAVGANSKCCIALFNYNK